MRNRVDVTPGSEKQPLAALFDPSRAAGLRRVDQFVARAGQAYADGRNTDGGRDGPAAVSRLSPYLRYRVISEREIVASVLDRHSIASAEKFIQEVLWRTYWKGWLELRPSVWQRFVEERDQQRDSFPNACAIVAAESGMTGIDGFDDWARELVETGYLHNHARMWFASVWIFTLRLPWALGADFFLRHLLDADAASNTLSWRWVAGLQTIGKTYLATAENIARYTNGRYAPAWTAAPSLPFGLPGPAYRRARSRNSVTARSNSFCATMTADGAFGAVASAPTSWASPGFAVNIGPPTIIPTVWLRDFRRICAIVMRMLSSWRSDPAVNPTTANHVLLATSAMSSDVPSSSVRTC